MRCETCTHWAQWKYSPDLGTCKKVVRFWDAYESGYDGDDETNAERASKFFVQDGEDWSASLFTRPDFGCVEHQEKKS